MNIPEKLYGIVGHPVQHSLSPAIHNQAFAALNIPAVYLRWDIIPDDLPAFVQAVRLLPIAGASVTIPHKEAIIPLVDRLTLAAQRVGAVNTLYFENGELIGHNTDVSGFAATLPAKEKAEKEYKTALILGAGGGAKAILSALLVPGKAHTIVIAARRKAQAEHLVASVKPYYDPPAPQKPEISPQIRIIEWEERNQILADIVINTTPLGLPHSASAAQSPMNTFTGTGLAYDLIYAPQPSGDNKAQTPFLAAAALAGWQTMDGSAMLMAQAKEQFRCWTGQEMPVIMLPDK